MRVHLAARRDRRPYAAKVAAALTAMGHTITTRWVGGKGKAISEADEAMHSLVDIAVADCLVFLSQDPRGKGAGAPQWAGRFVELGYALRAGKKVMIAGPHENIFDLIAEAERFPSVKTMLAAMTDLAALERLDAPPGPTPPKANGV
jgi:hypothetical protein